MTQEIPRLVKAPGPDTVRAVLESIRKKRYGCGEVVGDLIALYGVPQVLNDLAAELTKKSVTAFKLGDDRRSVRVALIAGEVERLKNKAEAMCL